MGFDSTFDSESFELELNGSAWDTSDLSFVQIPSEFSGFRDQVSPRHVHHERTVHLNEIASEFSRTTIRIRDSAHAPQARGAFSVVRGPWSLVATLTKQSV
jgi:hypothetical protein